ncbi:hypothetical protein BX666DRAFT_1950319 [Dichotomocladium elegans]|nr:hypothetical protein BX666DRAFT_1950319 [Dichotomocladium elegans]
MEIYDSAIFANDDDDPKNYVSSFASLSQLDLDLQQQAQATLQPGVWPDLDMFLPQFDYQPLFYNGPATPPSAFPTPPPPPQQSLEQSFPPLFDATLFDNTLLSQAISTVQNKTAPAPPASAIPISPPLVSFENTPVVLSQTPEIKSEPETLLPSSSNFGNDLLEAAFPASPEEDKRTALQPENLISGLWSPPEANGKVPIQRLKLSTTSPVNTPIQVAAAGPPPGRQQKKTAHNAIERRYRNNINDRITELKNAVPALVHARVKDSRTGKRSHRSLEEDDDDGEDGEEFVDGVAVATKLNKATILRKATEYITHLKQTGEDMQQENTLLQQLLSQLPGGTEVLNRYRTLKLKREQDLQHQRMQERQTVTKHQRKHTRKRTKTQEVYSSPSSSDPATPPPAVGNRVFMAIFAFLTFFSSSPLTTGPSSAEQFQNHQHSARTTSADSTTVNTTSDSKNMALDSFLPFEDGWNMLRTAVFILFLVHLLLPLFGSWLWPFSFNIKRVSRTKRIASHKRISTLKSNANVASTLAFTPGDQKCFQIYDILVKTLEANDDGPPRTALGSVIRTMKEICRFISRHVLEYEILYNEDDQLIPEDEWERACHWIKLNEIECLGGNPEATRWTMLYSCLRMINLVEAMESEDHPDLAEMRARVYTTAAMQLSSVFHDLPFSKRLVRDFLVMAICEAVPDINNTDGDIHMRSLTYTMLEDNTISLQDQVDAILKSKAWGETVQIINHQTGQSPGMISLSLASPILVPAALLSNLHLLDVMQKQYDRLINSMVNRSSSASNMSDIAEAICFNPTPMADPEQQQLAYWLAAVGMTVESLWKNDLKETEKYLEAVVKRVPRGVTSGHGCQDIVVHKKRMSELDELTKKSIVRILVGAILIKRGDPKQGVQQLEQVELIRAAIKDKISHAPTKKDKPMRIAPTLETTVLAQAEFAAGLVGLEAWILAWKLTGQGTVRVRETTIGLRRRLNGVKASQAVVEQLSQLTRFLGRELDDYDSADEASDLDDGDDDDDGDDTNERALQHDTNEEGVVKRADKALDILHGIATS